MKKIQKAKLRVRGEVVRELGQAELRGAIGGIRTPTWSTPDADGDCDCFPPPLRGGM